MNTQLCLVTYVPTMKSYMEKEIKFAPINDIEVKQGFVAIEKMYTRARNHNSRRDGSKLIILDEIIEQFDNIIEIRVGTS